MITLPQNLTHLTIRELIVELDQVEQTIRSTSISSGEANWPTSSPGAGNELKHLAEREQEILAELARRRAA